ncbi:MAG: DMT family transporter [Xanthobacteraceae bacterium]|nr:DMT family transporter [Xanthobacteraceae bacterium]
MNSKPAAGAFSANLSSIFYMVLAQASFASNDINTKIAVKYLPVPEIIAIRGAAAFLFAFALVCFVHGIGEIRKLANRNLFWRSLFEASVGPMVVTCYAFLPLATVTAIVQVGPFMGMIAGIYLFRESVGWRRWCAALVAFAGVLLIIKPGGETFQPIALIVLLIAAAAVGRDIQSRKVGGAAPTFVVPLGTAIMSMTLAAVLTPIMLPFGLKVWGPWLWPNPPALALCCLAGFFLVLANTFAFLAFRTGDMAVVSPFRYFYLFFAVIGGVIIFSEIPDRLSFVGMGLIVISGIYLLHRERLNSKRALAAASPRSGE